MITIQNKRRKLENIQKDFPNATIIDVTSKGKLPYVKFSPFYPVGDIPVPYSDNCSAASVEGIWQGLKVFENHDVDRSKFEITSMKGLKRTVRKFGKPLGHRKGVEGKELLDYISARKEIYLPVYEWVLKHKLEKELQELRKLHQQSDLVLLDYETNEDVENGAKPLSHASIVKRFLEGL